MDDFKEGIVEVIGGILGSIFYSAALSSLTKDKNVTNEYLWILPFISIAGNISTIFFLKKAGLLFNIGCIVGAWLLRNVMDTGDFILYFFVPIGILIARIYFLFKSNSD